MSFHTWYSRIKSQLVTIPQEAIITKISQQTELSLVFFILLTLSAVLTTLGLLLDSAPVVIGGMIVAPLVWPLMKTALGIAAGNKKFVYQALFVLALSSIVALLSAYAITYFSPIKFLNQEILDRTRPTLIDIIIGLSAGTIAALTLIHKKVSDVLAGVAVAASLMPPLCVAGIGLALGEQAVYGGSSLLAATNMISIVLAGSVIFIVANIKHPKKETFQRFSIVFTVLILIFISLPLGLLLKDYSFQVRLHQRIQHILTNRLMGLAPEIEIKNIKTQIYQRGGREVIDISADVLLPEAVILEYQHKNDLSQELESEFGRPIDLNLRIQKTLSIATEQDAARHQIVQQVQKIFANYIYQIDSDITIADLTLSFDNNIIVVSAALRADPTVRLSEAERKNIEQQLTETLMQKVELDIEVVPRVNLRFESELYLERIKGDVQKFFSTNFPTVDVVNIVFQTPSPSLSSATAAAALTPPQTITISLQKPPEVRLTQTQLLPLKNSIAKKYGITPRYTLNILQKQIITLP